MQIYNNYLNEHHKESFKTWQFFVKVVKKRFSLSISAISVLRTVKEEVKNKISKKVWFLKIEKYFLWNPAATHPMGCRP